MQVKFSCNFANHRTIVDACVSQHDVDNNIA